MRQHSDETAIEFARRVIGWLNSDDESILMALPSIQAVFDYAELWSVYDTDLMGGIIEAIEDGEDAKPLADFIAKYNLPWTVPVPEPVEST